MGRRGPSTDHSYQLARVCGVNLTICFLCSKKHPEVLLKLFNSFLPVHSFLPFTSGLYVQVSISISEPSSTFYWKWRHFYLSLTLTSNHRFTFFFFGCTGSWLLYRLSRVSVSRICCPSQGPGFSLSRLLFFWSLGYRVLRFQELQRVGSAVMTHRLSCSMACGIFPNQGAGPCPLYWLADSCPL